MLNYKRLLPYLCARKLCFMSRTDWWKSAHIQIANMQWTGSTLCLSHVINFSIDNRNGKVTHLNSSAARLFIRTSPAARNGDLYILQHHCYTYGTRLCIDQCITVLSELKFWLIFLLWRRHTMHYLRTICWRWLDRIAVLMDEWLSD